MKNREIKFRAWWPGVKQMKYFVPGHFEDTPNGYAMTFVQPNGNGSIFLGKAEIMQFTGLKDKNGKDIYEGDIVKVDWQDLRYKSVICVVEWDDSGAGWNFGAGVTSEVKWSHEVIGNIFQNADLLTPSTP